MSATLSKMVDLGTPAPDFNLKDAISGEYVTLNGMKSEIATVIMFICNHCPYVKHIYHDLSDLAKEYIPKGISFAAINSNNYLAYPDDSPEKMKDLAIELGFTFPYLVDESQDVAKSYQATCTPDFFVYDKNLKLVYRGQFDDSRPGNGKPVTGKDLRNALESLLNGGEVNKEQIPSIGCNIKWK